jgi:hypothetical protein
MDRNPFEDLAREAAEAARRARDAAEWPEPDLALLTPHRCAAPALPLDVFGPFWSGWIADAAEAKGSPADFVALGLLAAAGALVANARRGSP